ncbi:hypothetical protein RFI_15428 [Reticulomyxa filosa]|uniref:CCDC113/CCDC96 coiled-coil domain-containing protein n=1 Tax=Reticulomyxa filosa TaxID=46433 RepID=X6N900_RETFI|nr:hypothetical protein RFI_15428 [Reticulomyxa filosa]|eukprot:ETO21777.1 hypothetical protein RFI_15428 [Reticulomyxa filosa]
MTQEDQKRESVSNDLNEHLIEADHSNGSNQKHVSFAEDLLASTTQHETVTSINDHGSEINSKRKDRDQNNEVDVEKQKEANDTESNSKSAHLHSPPVPDIDSITREITEKNKAQTVITSTMQQNTEQDNTIGTNSTNLPPIQHLTIETPQEASLTVINSTNRLQIMIDQAKQENKRLQSRNCSLIQQIIYIIDQNGGGLGLEADIPTITTNAEPPESQYANLLKQVCQLHAEYAQKQHEYSNKLEQFNDRVLAEDDETEQIRNSYKEFKRKLSANAINIKTQKPISKKWILQKEQEEEEVDRMMETNRLKKIHFQMQLVKFAQRIKEKDRSSEKLHFIDFEQLKIENQTLSEKIEERNDELHKLRRKIMSTVQILAHVKEKLLHVRKMNDQLSEEQKNLDNSVNVLRDKVTDKKRERDNLRHQNNKLKQRESFVGNDMLVTDFQKRKVLTNSKLQTIILTSQEMENNKKRIIDDHTTEKQFEKVINSYKSKSILIFLMLQFKQNNVFWVANE